VEYTQFVTTDVPNVMVHSVVQEDGSARDFVVYQIMRGVTA